MCSFPPSLCRNPVSHIRIVHARRIFPRGLLITTTGDETVYIIFPVNKSRISDEHVVEFTLHAIEI